MLANLLKLYNKLAKSCAGINIRELRTIKLSVILNKGRFMKKEITTTFNAVATFVALLVITVHELIYYEPYPNRTLFSLICSLNLRCLNHCCYL